jgi:hypothetical protein
MNKSKECGSGRAKGVRNEYNGKNKQAHPVIGVVGIGVSSKESFRQAGQF